MARLMLSVGDMQVSVQPVPGSVSGSPDFAALPDDHPLKAGDHEVVFYETGLDRGDEVCSKIMGEAEALEVVGLWLTLETEREMAIENSYGALAEGVVKLARVRLRELMGLGIQAFLP